MTRACLSVIPHASSTNTRSGCPRGGRPRSVQAMSGKPFSSWAAATRADRPPCICRSIRREVADPTKAIHSTMLRVAYVVGGSGYQGRRYA